MRTYTVVYLSNHPGDETHYGRNLPIAVMQINANSLPELAEAIERTSWIDEVVGVTSAILSHGQRLQKLVEIPPEPTPPPKRWMLSGRVQRNDLA